MSEEKEKEERKSAAAPEQKPLDPAVPSSPSADAEKGVSSRYVQQ
jgi:hypothetical protein